MRTKKVILNFLTDAIPQIFIIIVGIFKIKIFLNYLGEDTLGLYQLFGKLFGYLTLIEGGVAVAGLYKLYKPLATKDGEKVSEILSAIKYVFRYIAFAMLVIGFILSFFIVYMIKDNSFSTVYVQTMFMLFLIMNIWSYFATANKLVFEADQRNYILNNINQPFNLIKSILELLVVFLGFGLIGLIVINLTVNIIINILIIKKSKKDYSYDYDNKNKDFSMMKDIKDLLVYKISWLIDSNIDVVIISATMGLKNVVIYSTYNYITDSIKQFTEKISSATQSGFGHLVSHDPEKSYDTFMEFNSFVFFLATIICVPLIFSINPFITIWYENKISTSFIYASLFVIILYYLIIRMPLAVYVNALGIFKDAKYATVLETISNLVLSLILGNIFGISGVLIATITSMVIFEYFGRSYVIIKNKLKNNIFKYYGKNLFFLAFTVISVFICNYVNNTLIYDNLLSWFLNSTLLFAINMILIGFFYYFSNNLKFILRVITNFKTNRKSA